MTITHTCCGADGTTPHPETCAAPVRGLKERLVEFERAWIVATLALYEGNQTAAARALGLKRRTLTNRMIALRIDGTHTKREPEDR